MVIDVVDHMAADKNIGFIRAFIAVELDDMTKITPILDDIKKNTTNIKIVNPENLHITLKFLGNVAESMVPEIMDIMRQSVDRIAPFTFNLIGMGAFPNINRINVVWIGLHNAQQLSTIAKNLEDKLEHIGIKRERYEFSPHLTLARVKSPEHVNLVRKIIKENETTNFGLTTAKSIVLKKSTLTSTSPVYTTIDSVGLK